MVLRLHRCRNVHREDTVSPHASWRPSGGQETLTSSGRSRNRKKTYGVLRVFRVSLGLLHPKHASPRFTLGAANSENLRAARLDSKLARKRPEALHDHSGRLCTFFCQIIFRSCSSEIFSDLAPRVHLGAAKCENLRDAGPNFKHDRECPKKLCDCLDSLYKQICESIFWSCSSESFWI